MLEIVYVVDGDSGWENDADICWVIDEGNQADWNEEQLCFAGSA